ncbi:LacI family DNA-binding transcriptional regulator [Microbacterium gorillae]|uniref:LacI family DNA-binding transcriptional regulator n=1 Tax=Microbacterium gorillae TaxID=1231063 RepID=UPI000693EC97|nr:substrate-binding domain-containing protein [Microbacterium gorillae]
MADQDAPSAPAGGTRRAPTIYDVANAAGVSHQTVSRLLKGEGIRPANRERIVQALDELGYRPNMAARSLATSRSRRIVAFVQDMSLFGPGAVLQGATTEARRAGYILDVVTLDVTDRGAIEDAIADVNGQDIAGILALALTDEMGAAFAAAHFRVPVFIDTAVGYDVGARAAVQNVRGIDMIIDHLVGQGHRDFFFISGPRGWWVARHRQSAYDAAIKRHGVHSHGTVAGDWTAASGYAGARQAMRTHGVTALVCANDHMAMGAILALSEAGISIPDDLSVTGFDDVPESSFLRPPLTTVRLDLAAQGRGAFRELLAVIDGEPEQPERIAVELLVRESTASAQRETSGH